MQLLSKGVDSELRGFRYWPTANAVYTEAASCHLYQRLTPTSLLIPGFAVIEGMIRAIYSPSALRKTHDSQLASAGSDC